MEKQRIGYTIKEGEHPIVPIMLGDAKLAQNIAQEMLDENIYVLRDYCCPNEKVFYKFPSGFDYFGSLI